jgi:hypothetical protein
MFAHMLADYVLQTNWLVMRKVKRLDGLLLHGAMVYAMSLLVLPTYLQDLFIPLTLAALWHTFQDWIKVYTGPRIKVPSIYSYLIDQFAHYGLIILLSGLLASRLSPALDPVANYMMGIGACVVAITRFYEVTWWSNFLNFQMVPYFSRWRFFEYAEHLAMFALALAGFAYLAPLCVIPRLVSAWRTRAPIWQQRFGLLEMGLGIVFAVALGLLMRSMWPVGLPSLR